MTLGSGVALVNGGDVRLDAARTTVSGDAFSIPVKCALRVVGIYNVPRQCGKGLCASAFAGRLLRWMSVASRGFSHSAW